ncbi:MAG: molybdopterin-dependent oxidoreductase [Acidobacteriota bacterium]
MNISRRSLLKLGLATSGAALIGPILESTQTVADSVAQPGEKLEIIPSMCQQCSTVCGIIGYVKNGRLVKIDGNPEDWNNRGRVCAKGQAGILNVYHPERLLYPLRRVGKRGEGRWKRISWDEAMTEIADRLKKIRESGKPEEFVIHQGRNRSPDIFQRFMNAFGTPTLISHRNLCSSNRRAAIRTYIWESEWDTGDYTNTKYILNFGCNIYEAHQGAIGALMRVIDGRVNNGAKLVTFEIRLSHTAGVSDEHFMPFPGTDGAIALAMGHVIMRDGLHNKEFLDKWTNYPSEKLWEHLKPYTPEWAEKLSGVSAKDISRIAIEFAKAAPACTTMSNRGSHAHRNGFYNDRAIVLLNALVGSVGTKGGWCWTSESYDANRYKVPDPSPEAVKVRSLLEDPKDFPLANTWSRMKVGGNFYHWVKQGIGKVQMYWTYNVDSPFTWPEGPSIAIEVLKDEQLVPFHVCLNQPFMSETGLYADIILPWTTYLERWDVDARNSQDLIPYVGLRQPIVKPLGESKDVRDIFYDLANRIGGGMEQYFAYGSTETYIREQLKSVPNGGLEYMKKHGVWRDPTAKPNYEPYKKTIKPEDMEGAKVDTTTGIITKFNPNTKREEGIGIMIDGKPVRGFKTPSRKFEIYSQFIVDIGLNRDTSKLSALAADKAKRSPGNDVVVNPLPIYEPIPAHQNLADDDMILTTFKWNVHTQGRTMNQKWLAELVHENPAWIHPKTANKYGLKNGDWIEITSYRPKDPTQINGDGSIVGVGKIPVKITKGVHPRVIAISNSCGHWEWTNVAKAIRASHKQGRTFEVAMDSEMVDLDTENNLWWEGKNGWNLNAIYPAYTDPVTGMQAWHDTVIKIRKLAPITPKQSGKPNHKRRA